MSLLIGQVADKIYLPGWIFRLPWATGQLLMLRPAYIQQKVPTFGKRNTCHRTMCSDGSFPDWSWIPDSSSKNRIWKVADFGQKCSNMHLLRVYGGKFRILVIFSGFRPINHFHHWLLHLIGIPQKWLLHTRDTSVCIRLATISQNRFPHSSVARSFTPGCSTRYN